MKMKDFAMTIWNMPSGDFAFAVTIAVIALVVIKQIFTEMNISRMIRMSKKTLTAVA
jgi:hypothetical protein